MPLNWLPLPADFRGELRAAQQVAAAEERLARLAILANHRLNFLETIQLDRVLGQTLAGAPAGPASLRLALLSSSTVDHLPAALRVAALSRNLRAAVYTGQYGQYRQEVMDPGSALYQFQPQFVVFSLSARTAIGGIHLGATAEEADRGIQAAVEELRMLWRAAKEKLKATVIQQTYLNLTEPLFGSFDRQVPGSPSRLVARLNDRVAEAAAADGVLLLDVARATERDGTEAWFDRTRWLQGKFEIAPQAAPAYAELAIRVVAAVRGLSRKCLVLDLDNTLWGGVIGDDGLAGIVLGEGSAAGEAHLALQRYAKSLKDRGIILAVCSKNDPAIAESVFRDHPEMVLKRGDIAAFVANWNDKAANLRQIAEQLNIGIDSLVFVDDNPVERARIRQSLPMVAVPELPADAADYVRCVAEAGYFEAVAFTAEDQQRGEQYAANASRDALLQSSQNMDDFLVSLEMSLAAGPFTPVDMTRVVQLINKTNQFNLTTRRYTGDEVERHLASDRSVTLQFRLVDRFGDNGLVAAMILRPAEDESSTLEIDTWIMSCRVFGRQLEFESMNIAVEAARQLGVSAIRGDYLPTPKNGVVKDLYSSLGFQPADHPAGNGATRWRLPLTAYTPHPTHINRRSN